MVKGFDIPGSAFDNIKCEPCSIGKSTKLPFKDSTTTYEKPMELVSMDVMGPFTPPTYGGGKYVATYIDHYTSYSIIKILKDKKEVTSITKETLKYMETQSGQTLKAIRTDRGLEYLNNELYTYLKDKGVMPQATMAYTHEQNGTAERLNLTLLFKAIPMLSASGLDLEAWGEALNTANTVRNYSPSSGKDKTPHEAFFGSKPDISVLRAFGSTAFVHIPKERRESKLLPRAEKGIMVGYPEYGKGYRILMPDGGIVMSRHVTFDESKILASTGFKEHYASLVPDYLKPKENANKTNTNPSSAFDPFDTEEVEDTPDIEPSTGHSDNTPAPNGPPEDDSSDNYEPVGAGDPTSNTSAPASNQVLRHSTRAPAPRRVFRHIDSYPSFFTSSLFTPGVFEPSTYEEAIASPDAPKWMAAMEEEMAALMANNTWSIIEDVPSYAKPIDTRWVFKVKIDANGSVERYKARLVAKGFKQIEGVDYNEVFAPVSKYTTLRAALSVAATKGYIINQVDVKNAFVQGSLKEEVYINLPSGFTTTKPVRLNKALYGLKQAPRAWHEVLNAKLINLGFKPSSADASLFIKGTSYLVVYVDDILVITPTEAEWHNFEGAFSKAFDIRTFPSVTSYLGIQFFRDATGIKLTHENFIKTLISKYDMEDAKPRTTPMSVHTKLTKDDGTPLDVHKFPYSSLVGALLFLASTTRPDIAFTVSALSRYMATPTIGHWETAKRVLRYLSSTATTGLFFEKCSSFDFKAFCDADYAADVSTRRSTTGFIFLLNGTAISWSSKLQKTVALSTSEAEYMAAAAAIKEALWLKTLFTDLSVPLTGPFNLYVDNQAALKILRNPVTTPRSKHIDVLYHFARERVMSGDIAVSYVESAHNLADVFTKPLPPVKHTACCTGFGML
jgi:hypothetical protein